MLIDGESSRLLDTAPKSAMKAEFPGESAAGNGIPEFDVCQNTPSGATTFVAVQPDGNAGTATLSKFSTKTSLGTSVTETDADAVPLPPLEVVKLAVLLTTTPQLVGWVALVTWTRVIVKPPNEVGVKTKLWDGGFPAIDQPGCVVPGSICQSSDPSGLGSVSVTDKSRAVAE